LVTLQTSGLDSDFSGNSVTFDGKGYRVYDGHSTTVWVDSGRTVNYAWASPISSTTSGKRYVITSTKSGSVTVNSPKTVSASYKTQYKWTFSQSGIGSDSTGNVVKIDGTNYKRGSLPKEFWWNKDSKHSYQYYGYVSTSTSGKRYACHNPPSASFTVTGSGSKTPSYHVEYYLDVNSPYDSPTGEGWYDAGSTAISSVSSPVSGGSGKRYVCTGYTGTGSAPSGSGTSISFTINKPSSITWKWKTQYKLTMKVSPSGAGYTSPSVGGHWYDSGSYVTIRAYAYSNYKFKKWVGSGSGSYTGYSSSATIRMYGPITETAYFQYTGKKTVYVKIEAWPTTDYYARSAGMSVDKPLPNDWWKHSGYYKWGCSSYFTKTITLELSSGSHYVEFAVSGYVPNYAWHAKIYINTGSGYVLKAQGDVGRQTHLKAYFTVP